MRSLYLPRLIRLRSAGMRGFTLIELMVAVAILAILLGIAVPSFNDAALGSKLGSHANNLVVSASLARSEAIKRNVNVTLCASADGRDCATEGDWEQGWVVKCKTTDNLNCNADGTNWLIIHRQQAASSGLKISEASAKKILAFSPTGVGAESATLTICRSSPTDGSQERVVSITATGRAYVTETTVGSCA